MSNKESRRNFIKKSTGTTAALLIPGLYPFYLPWKDAGIIDKNSNSDNREYMYAGFAELDISPEIGMEKPGNYGKAFHKSFHDPCKVRTLVIGKDKHRVAIAGIDTLMVPRSLVLSVRKKVHERCGISEESILISASHSHSSGPLGMVQPGEYDHADSLVRTLAYEESSCADPKYLTLVENKLTDAICLANDSVKKSLMGVGIGNENKVAFNRRFHMENGITYTHPGQGNPDIIKPAGPVDPEVGVIGAWDEDGKCMGCIVNYACHATTNPGGISANWIYYLEQTIRGAMGRDCIVVFLPGANGNITQVNNLNPYVNRAGEDWARFVGGRLGAEAVKVLLSMPRGIMQPIDAKNRIMNIPRRKPDPERVKKCYELVKKSPEEVDSTEWIFAKEIVLLDALLAKEPVAEVEVQAIQIGPVILITNPAEFFCEFGLEIKKKSPYEFTFPVELANGCVGYVPTEEAFGPHGGGYETRLTSYSNLEISAGNKMVEAGLKLAKKMKPGVVPEFQKAQPYLGYPWSYGNVKPEIK